MDWHKFSNHKAFKYSLIGFTSALVIGFFALITVPVIHEFNDSFAMKEFKTLGLVGTYRAHYQKFIQKVDSLANADIHEQKLIRELAILEKDLEIEKLKNSETESKKETHEIAERLKTEAGSSIARVPEDIKYTIPAQMLPHQLQVLGMEYFRKQDYEKSAVIFHELTHLKDTTIYLNPDNYLVSAISWYHLKHYEMASDYLKMAEKSTAQDSELFRQTLLWQAMVENVRGHKSQSQKVLTRLMTLFPQSEESKLINVSRVPASKKEKEDADE